jgi:hypothetical protein
MLLKVSWTRESGFLKMAECPAAAFDLRSPERRFRPVPCSLAFNTLDIKAQSGNCEEADESSLEERILAAGRRKSPFTG